MRLTSRVPLLAASLVATVAVARPAAAQCPLGSYTCYFGTDIGGTGFSKPPSTAVSDAAAAAFLARLVGAGTETFEGIPAGSTSPIALNFPGVGPCSYRVPRSLSYESMDQDEFHAVIAAMCAYVAKTYWPSMDAERIEAMASAWVEAA